MKTQNTSLMVNHIGMVPNGYSKKCPMMFFNSCETFPIANIRTRGEKQGNVSL